jgi:hypothetical protein
VNLERRDHLSVEVVTDRITVVTALPLKRPARERLAELLGARVVDVRHPIDEVDLVLTPSCSPQLIAALKRKYSGARVVVVELDDWEFGIALPGPVKRILKGGADGYVLADSLDELARKISPPSSDEVAEPSEEVQPLELLGTPTVDDLIAAFLRESDEYAHRLRADEDNVD